MKLSVSETSKLVGVSVRTLHYYDEIGLLKPSEKTDAGYRFYDDENLEVLQQILFFRELEFSLDEIGRILSQPDFDRKQALRDHRDLLLVKQRHIGDLLMLVDETLEGRENMSKDNAIFTDYEAAREKYADEAKARWGSSEAYQESAERDKRRSKEESISLMGGAGEIFKAFAALRDKSPSDPDVQAHIRKWQAFITDNFYTCTNEILAGLGEMYVADSRFTENIDRYGSGTAQFISEAIRTYCAGG
jgi:DNA-binding transcriptional MerR regulator